MAWTLLLALWATDAAVPAACADWVVHGYHIGMTLEEAKAVRPFSRPSGVVKRAKKSIPPGTEIREAQDPGRFDGTLYFERGRLISYAATIDAGAADRDSLEAALRDKLGDPLPPEAIQRSWPRWAGASQGITQQVLWLSEPCDTAVRLVGAQPPGIAQPVVVVSLESPSHAGAAKATDTDRALKALE